MRSYAPISVEQKLGPCSQGSPLRVGPRDVPKQGLDLSRRVAKLHGGAEVHHGRIATAGPQGVRQGAPRVRREQEVLAAGVHQGQAEVGRGVLVDEQRVLQALPVGVGAEARPGINGPAL